MAPDVTIHPVPRPNSVDAEPHPLLLAIDAAEDAVEIPLYGHRDFHEGLRSRMVRLVGSDNARTLYWAALRSGTDPAAAAPGDALGYAAASLPLKEDTATAIVHVAVVPEARSCGIGQALLDAVLAAPETAARTLWQAYAYSPGPPATGPDAIAPTDGPGAVDGSLPWNRWLVRDGWALEICERPSCLELTPEALDRAVALGEEANAAGAGRYVLDGWAGATPPEYADAVCRVMERMVTDVPNGGMEYDEQHWTPERLAGVEARRITSGQASVSTVALDATTGQVAGFTEIVWPVANPAGVWQEETLVLTEHRGHRLGLAMKTANLARLVTVNPDAARVHTWNAVENGPMLAINDALGFVGTGLEGAWQKRR